MTTPKRHGFIAFIDESGQEGGNNRSSDFFIISALVVRTDKGNVPVTDALDQASKTLGHGKSYRFKKFSNEKKANRRFVIATELGKCQSRYAAIVCCKALFKERDMTDKYGKLYFYASHLLLERISWICRDAHKEKPSGNGKAIIIFSHRTSLNYKTFAEYARDIKEGKGKVKSHAAWDHIDLKAIRAIPHSKNLDGLLAVDYIASSFGCALEHNPYGLTDDRFVRALNKTIYRYKDRCFGNGFKMFPPESESLIYTDERLWWFAKFFKK